MYEVMTFWETAETGGPSAGSEYAEIWQANDKIVYSRELEEVTTARTTLEREFDPDRVRELKDSAQGNLSIGGPTLATAALEAGLVDEIHLFVVPAIVGGGLPALPTGLRAELELLGERRFRNGTVHMHHRVVG